MNKSASKKVYKANELSKFRESLPMHENDFMPLFDFLNSELSQNGCKDDCTFLRKYCADKDIDSSVLEKWFAQNGAFCDCEIIANVEEKFEYLNKLPHPQSPIKKGNTQQRKKLNALTTDFGFVIKKVPAPWILTAITTKNDTVYQFQIGKKSDFLTYLQSESCEDKPESYFQNYWLQKTELDSEIEFVIDRQCIFNFEMIQVRTKRWMPIFAFIFNKNGNWCLIMKTDTTRVRNDLKELEKLLTEIEI